MDILQIPAVAIFTGMIVAFALVMVYGTISEYRHG